MEIAERQEGDVAVLALAGEVDLETSPELRAALRKRPPGPLIVDFSGVSYIDSSGLATLIEHYQRMGKLPPPRPKLLLAGLSPRVAAAFELVRLNEIFPSYPDVPAAAAALAAD